MNGHQKRFFVLYAPDKIDIHQIYRLNTVKREDIDGFFQGTAWAGRGAMPFGLVNCQGWKRHAVNLSNKLAALNRRGESLHIVNIRAGSLDETVLVNLRGCKNAAIEHLNQFKARCIKTCQQCGKRTKLVTPYGVWCSKHSHVKFRKEIQSDKRAIRREQRSWAKRSGAKWPTRYAKIGIIRLPIYVIDGVDVVRPVDASPGCRQEVFDGLLDEKLTPVDVCGEFVFSVNQSRIIKRAHR